jgi:putative nucleotidyltransferase with HDIG domain
MTQQKTNFGKDRVFQWGVTVAGGLLWLWSLARLGADYEAREQLIFLGLLPVVIFVSHFTQHFRLPFGIDLTRERMTVSLSDALVLLVACWYGVWPAVFAAGVEGFAASRRTTRRPSSNLFSFGMMSLAAGAGALTLSCLLGTGAGGAGRAASGPSFQLIALALFAASAAHSAVNLLLLFTLVALRHRKPIVEGWRSGLAWAAPVLCLPTGVVAVMMYHALEHGLLNLLVIGVPALLAMSLAQRQSRRGVEQRVAAVEKAHRETVEALAVAINAKDQVTHDHVLRVQIYASGVARLLGCTEAEIEALKAGALLHDIGKIAVPDYILNKPGKLTAAEFDRMKIHTVVGAQILGRVDFPYPVMPVVRHHHERWDGRGYPDGLRAEQIPLTARILSVVDCFDAVREDRQYRRGLTREEAVELIEQASGTQYDPRVVETFVAHLPEFEAEIAAARGAELPTFGIEPAEQLSEAAREVAPAAGLAEEAHDAGGAGRLSQLDLAPVNELAGALERVRPNRASVVETFAARLAALVPFDTCAVVLTSADGGHTVAHAAGRDAELLRGRAVVANEGVTGWVIANQKPFCNVDPRLDLPDPLGEHFADYRALASVPLASDRQAHGALTLYTAALAEYTPAQLRLLEAAAAVLATALSPATRATAAAPDPARQDPRAPDAHAQVFNSADLKPLRAALQSKMTH